MKLHNFSSGLNIALTHLQNLCSEHGVEVSQLELREESEIKMLDESHLIIIYETDKFVTYIVAEIEPSRLVFIELEWDEKNPENGCK